MAGAECANRLHSGVKTGMAIHRKFVSVTLHPQNRREIL